MRHIKCSNPLAKITYKCNEKHMPTIFTLQIIEEFKYKTRELTHNPLLILFMNISYFSFKFLYSSIIGPSVAILSFIIEPCLTYLNLLKRLTKGGAALDVGANVGNHSHAFAQHFDEVHAFEPFELVAQRLEIKVRPFNNVNIHRLLI